MRQTLFVEPNQTQKILALVKSMAELPRSAAEPGFHPGWINESVIVEHVWAVGLHTLLAVIPYPLQYLGIAYLFFRSPSAPRVCFCPVSRASLCSLLLLFFASARLSPGAFQSSSRHASAARWLPVHPSYSQSSFSAAGESPPMALTFFLPSPFSTAL